MEQAVKFIQELFLCLDSRVEGNNSDLGAREMRETADNDISQIQFRHVCYLVST